MEFDLWDELMAMERRMDALFRGFLGTRARPWYPVLPTGFRQPFLPAADVYATDRDLIVRLELPGVDPAQDVTVTVEDGVLIVRGERKRHEEIKEEDYYRMESSYGAFERHVPLPEGYEEKAIKAEYRDGVLEIVVPGIKKALEKGKPEVKAIPIKSVKTTKAA
jgi:HSP20 family protein